MYAVMTTSANIYKRMWCVFEMYVCNNMQIETRLLIHSQYRDRQRVSTKGTRIKHVKVITADFMDEPIDSKFARCGNPNARIVSNDEKQIRARIEDLPGSYQGIDKSIELLRAVGYAATADGYRALSERPKGPRNITMWRSKIFKLCDAWDRINPGTSYPVDWEPFQIATGGVYTDRALQGLLDEKSLRKSAPDMPNLKLGRFLNRTFHEGERFIDCPEFSILTRFAQIHKDRHQLLLSPQPIWKRSSPFHVDQSLYEHIRSWRSLIAMSVMQKEAWMPRRRGEGQASNGPDTEDTSSVCEWRFR